MKHLLFGACLLLMHSVSGQKIVKDHYTVSGGLLGSGNFSKFRVSGNDNLDFKTKFGWGIGGWINFPLGKVVSLEPQVIYNSYAYSSDNSIGFFQDANAGYLSVPVLFKFHLGKNFALTAGPQFDFLMSVNDNLNINDKEDLKSTSISGNFGIEIVPHARVVPFARYIHGFTNMDNTGNPNTVGKFYNQNIQVGLKLRLFGKHILADSDGDGILDKDDKCPSVVGLARYNGCPIPDTDGDGINDEEDKCPSVAGLAKYQGCPIPDTDKDGVNDEQDKCPTVAGLAKYNGCPIPDTDGDGINDEQDKCPTVAGLAKYNGCPIPDTDGDGINDEEDRCPNVAGIPENLGCIDLKFYYKRDVADLSAADKASLDKVAEFMQNNPDLSITVEGHTSTLGATAYNQTLSEKRAGNCVKYLVSKGIDKSRLTAVGYGEQFPIGDNSKEEGRAQSRRVVFRVNK
jgi:outer membrane protein OmpA-like peptidoglycan-associated protein